jgi:hypothetical protein
VEGKMGRTNIALLTDPAYHPIPRQTRKEQLSRALNEAALAARLFAESAEAGDDAQRQRYAALADTLFAQDNSLKAEVV